MYQTKKIICLLNDDNGDDDDAGDGGGGGGGSISRIFLMVVVFFYFNCKKHLPVCIRWILSLPSTLYQVKARKSYLSSPILIFYSILFIHSLFSIKTDSLMKMIVSLFVSAGSSRFISWFLSYSSIFSLCLSLSLSSTKLCITLLTLTLLAIQQFSLCKRTHAHTHTLTHNEYSYSLTKITVHWLFSP